MCGGWSVKLIPDHYLMMLASREESALDDSDPRHPLCVFHPRLVSIFLTIFHFHTRD